MKTIAIDIDGVIAIPNAPDTWEVEHFLLAEGAKEALEKLSKDFLVILHSARGPYQLDKTVEWLMRHGIYQYIYQVHLGKPLAEYYIDDKAVHHTTWKDTLDFINLSELHKIVAYHFKEPIRVPILDKAALSTGIPQYNWDNAGEHHNGIFNEIVANALKSSSPTSECRNQETDIRGIDIETYKEIK